MEYACKYFEVDALRDILDIVYGEDNWSPNRTGDFSPYVIKAAYEGDAVSQEILESAGEDLARTALSVLEQMDGLGKPITVGLVGGVFTHAGDILYDAFHRELAAKAPKARTVLSRSNPVLGALVMGYRNCGGSEEASFRKRVTHELVNKL